MTGTRIVRRLMRSVRRRTLLYTSLSVAALSGSGVIGGAQAQTVSLPPFLELRVPKSPTIATANESSLLVHELHVTNFTADTVTLTRVEVVRAGHPSDVLLALADTALEPNVTRPGSGRAASARTTLPGGTRAIVYLWMPVPGSASPDSILHRVTIAQRRGDSTQTEYLEGAIVPVLPETATIFAPLRGGVWLTGNGPAIATGHRRGLIAVNGRPSIAQRFAIDYVKVDEHGRRFTGDSLDNDSYYAHGEEALAVAAATVAAIKDGIPENVPGPASRAVPITLETVGGNHVILDLGDGRFAFYAHLQPGSLRVRLGDRVQAGQVIGLVGNSGNSTEPHLHFHIADGVSPLGSEGVPYRQQTFEILGSCRGFAPDCARHAPDTRRGEQPMGGMLLSFPE